jgi:hypothetical protein
MLQESQTTYLCQEKGKELEGVAQVVKCLFSKCEVLSSNSSPTKNKKTKTYTHTKKNVYQAVDSDTLLYIHILIKHWLFCFCFFF